VEESKEPRQEGAQEVPMPSGMEETESELGQELPVDSEGPAAEGQPEEMGVAEGPTGPAFDRRRYLLPGALAAAVVAFAAVGIFALGMFTHSRFFDEGGGGQPAAVGQPSAVAQPTAGPTAVVGPVDVSADDDPAIGPANAPVTIIEFSDFQCPYCSRFNTDTLPQILSNYGDRVRFVYRDFPLTSLHANALKAAEASDCANEQGAYWKYHDLLFKNQSALDDASLKSYAASLGLDTGVFNQCLDSDKYISEVQKDYQDGVTAGVQGTPSFFVNGMPLTGAQPYSAFQAAIEAALKTAGG
jgi:protein-disulfide isomerase